MCYSPSRGWLFMPDLGLVCEEGVAVDVERACLVFSGCAAEGVARVADLDVTESGLFEKLLPTRTG